MTTQPAALRRLAASAALASALAGLTGCALVQSQPTDSAPSRQGVPYMLPKALLPVQLVEADGVLMLRLMPAQTVGDPDQRYLLTASANAFASDDVKIEVDPATGLLTKLTATADDQTLAVLSELFKASRVRRAESGGAGGETLLFSGLFDPGGDLRQGSPNHRLHQGLQRALLSRIDARVGGCAVDAKDTDCVMARALQPRLAVALAPNAGAEAAVVRVTAQPLGQAGADASNTGTAAGLPSPPQADCSIGVCHRALRPFLVELGIDGVFAQSLVLMLPNGGAPVALSLDRAPFVKTEHVVDFSGGQLQSVHSKRPSSALALVKWPLDVYQAVLQATSTLITLRIGANDNEVKLAQSRLDTAKELKRLADELDKLKAEGGTLPPPALRVGGPQRGGALIAVELGQRPTLTDTTRPTTVTSPPGPGTLPGQPK